MSVQRTVIGTFDVNETLPASGGYIASGPSTIRLRGSFGSGTVTIYESDDSVNWIPLRMPDGTDAAFTDEATIIDEIVGGHYLKGVMTGATSPEVVLSVVGQSAGKDRT